MTVQVQSPPALWPPASTCPVAGRTNFECIVKRSGPIYDPRDNGPHVQDLGTMETPMQILAERSGPHTFQAVMNLPFEAANCFQAKHPAVVPAKTFLSQLL